jgi:hypothetical protein
MGNFKSGIASRGKKLNQRLSILPSSGGISTVPRVICLANAFASEFIGSWFCFHGDGTSHGVVAGVPVASGIFTAVGSPVARNNTILPNGPNGGLISGMYLNGSSGYLSAARLTPTGSFSVGVLHSDGPRGSDNCLMGVWGASAAVNAYFLDQGANSAGVSFYCTDGSHQLGISSTYLSPTSSANLSVGTFAYVAANNTNQTRIYDNGPVSGAQTSNSIYPVQALTAQIGIGQTSAGTLRMTGTVYAAFLTEKVLSAATVQAMSDYATGKVSGSFGETLTYTRASVGSVIANDGTVVMLPAGRPPVNNAGVIIEPAATNLIVQSQALGTTWTAVAVGAGVTTVPTNNTTETQAPDGTYTASKVVLSAVATGGANASTMRALFTATASATYTWSVWLKSATSSTVPVNLTNSGATKFAPVSCAVTSTWTRFTGTGVAGGGTTTLDIGAVYVGAILLTQAAQTIYAWGAQVELGSAPSSYIPTTTASVARAAGVLTANPNGATNLCLQSQALGTTPWSVSNASVSAVDTVAAPDGTLTADTITSNTTNAAHVVYQTFTGTNAPWVGSVFVKAGTATWFSFSIDGGGSYGWINGATGALGTTTGYTATSTYVGNGWFRFSLSKTHAGGASNVQVGVGSANATHGTTALDGYAWGAQVELGSKATTYLPTTTVAASALDVGAVMATHTGLSTNTVKNFTVKSDKGFGNV